MAADSNKICITVRDADLLKRFDDTFEVRNAPRNIEMLLDAYDECNSLRRDFETLTANNNTLQEQNERLAATNSELQQRLQQLEDSPANNAELQQRITELEQQLAESQQTTEETGQSLADALQKLTAQRLSDDAIVIDNPGFVGKLLTATAEKLSVKYKREITPQMILQDMFLRYTVQRWSEWFYPFILKDKDIEEISGYTISQIKQAINK